MGERVIKKNIALLCEEYDKVFGTNKNYRTSPSAISDGLKLVNRRLLYMMFLRQGKSALKVETIDGAVIGALHSHGPTAVYNALINIAQPWKNNIPLIHVPDNVGTISGDPAGAARYISARISDYAWDCFFADWKYSIVDMTMGYDEKTKESVYLPAKYPNVLINGILGIGYGDNSNIPPFNFTEVVTATIKLMKNPEANVMLIPDSPTGCDIVESNFKKIFERGIGVYKMRCTYEIDAKNNIIRITSLPYQVNLSNSKDSNGIIERIADIKEAGGLSELIGMADNTTKSIDLSLHIRKDVNPYKFMKKLIETIAGLQRDYCVNITVVDDYRSQDYSVRGILLEWIKYRREQKHIVLNNKLSILIADIRINDIMIFILSGNNIENTIKLFRSSKNKAEIERRLVEEYSNTEIHMDSLQAKTLSELRMYELSTETRDACIEKRETLKKELEELEEILNDPNGADKIIIEELQEGIKLYGSKRRSRIVPNKIDVTIQVDGSCYLYLSADGNIQRVEVTNEDADPVPLELNSFAVKVENDSAFIVIDEKGNYSLIKASDIPLDNEVPISRFTKNISDKIAALVPYDIDSPACCTLISKYGSIKKFRVSELRPSKKPCMELLGEDSIISGIYTKDVMTKKNVLVFTDHGYGQVIDPNEVRLVGYSAKGINWFKLKTGDEIVGAYLVNDNLPYLLYVTTKGKMRLNRSEFLPIRKNKGDEMIRLISLSDREKLLMVVGCLKSDSLEVFFSDDTSETIQVKSMKEQTMGSLPEKVVSKNMVSNNIVKVLKI